MSDAFTLAPPGLKPLDLLNAAGITKPDVTNDMTRARAAAQDFEAVFINSMFSQMFTDVGGEGPFGGAGATGVWRSLLTQEYSKSFVKAGGIGIANDVYRSLLAHQEQHS